MALITVNVICPDRTGLSAVPGGGLPWFYSGGLAWPVGTTQTTLLDTLVAAMEGEITRGESILTIQRVNPPGATTSPASIKQNIGEISPTHYNPRGTH